MNRRRSHIPKARDHRRRYEWIYAAVESSAAWRHEAICTVWHRKNASNFQMKTFRLFFMVNPSENLHASTYDLYNYIKTVKKLRRNGNPES